MRIDGRLIGDGHPVFFIAEIGVNHNGSLETAKELIDVAIEAKADAVKFQTFNAELLASNMAPKAKYQETDEEETQVDMLKKYEFTKNEFEQLKDYCDQNGIIFLSTPFDVKSVNLLKSLDVPLFKVGSGDLTDDWLLESISKCSIPTILSTGMSNIKEIEHAIDLFDRNNIALLHCVSSYPTPKNQVNLNAIRTLKSLYSFPIGFSDHTEGNEIALAAVAIGANIIEKHFTLDRNLPGPDHKSSIEPGQLIELISQIRNIEKALGDGRKIPQNCEIETKTVARKSIVAKETILEGTKITNANVVMKRPGNGIKPKDFEFIAGRIAKRDIKKDELISLDMLQ